MTTLERPVLAVDVVLLQVQQRQLQVLLHRRDTHPFVGALALPGVALRADETLQSAARRALTKTGLDPGLSRDLFLEQLATFDALYRDPRGRTVSVAHLGLCEPGAALDPAAAAWVDARPADLELPFDHAHILDTARARLRGKIRYTNMAARLLPESFRIDTLQDVYEAILERRLNRANFRTKLLKIGLIERTGVLSDAVSRKGGRPPHLYRFRSNTVAPEDREFV
ncbi:MAG: NUDIX hydrolase [Myxococcota bacterium]